MKTILLMIGCFAAIYSVATAQVLNEVRPSVNKTTPVSHQIAEPTPTAQSGNDYALLDNKPFFPGGQQALRAYFGDLTHCSHQTRIGITDATVKVLFRVLPNGQLAELRIVQSGGAVLDRAVLSAVSVMPRWYPAHRAGVAVSSLYILPIRFTDTDHVSGNQRTNNPEKLAKTRLFH